MRGMEKAAGVDMTTLEPLDSALASSGRNVASLAELWWPWFQISDGLNPSLKRKAADSFRFPLHRGRGILVDLAHLCCYDGHVKICFQTLQMGLVSHAHTLY